MPMLTCEKQVFFRSGMAYATEESVAEFHKRMEEYDAFVKKLIEERPERYKSYTPVPVKDLGNGKWSTRLVDGLIYHLAPELFEPGERFGFPK